MRRTLLISLLVVGAAVALAIGSYSALAGAGPVTSVAGAVIGADEPDDVDVLDAVETDDLDGDDVDGDDVHADDGDGGEAKGARHIAGLIEGAFDAEEGSAWALHEQGIGFGALFKLYALAAVMEGTTVQDLLVTNGNGEYEFGFGDLRKDLTPEQQAALDSGPKNLGQLVSASHHEDSGGAGAVSAQGGGQGHAFGRDHGQGKPQGVPSDSDGE